MSDITMTTNARQDRAAVASQWQLIWWAFKRHKLAMAALFITIAMYIVALVPGFSPSTIRCCRMPAPPSTRRSVSISSIRPRVFARAALLSAEADPQS